MASTQALIRQDSNGFVPANLVERIPFRERLSCTIQDAVDATGLSRSKIYEKIAAGSIITTKVDGRRLVLVDSLKSLVTFEPPAIAPDTAAAAPNKAGVVA
jgi:hypothetical protein